MDIPGGELQGVWSALDFLTRVKLGQPPPIGPRIVVTGAGYTAQDTSRTCVRLGHHVQILYRRRKDDMPIWPFLRDRAVARQEAEGAPYIFQTTPVRILGENGRVVGVECVRTTPRRAPSTPAVAPRRCQWKVRISSSSVTPCSRRRAR